ncbi:MAG TPA: hypothetical protein VNK24_05695 [Elusimicrobiota bacterium]|nr:hypothetical protein [Elusimicrobiota bacterium]
MKPSSLKRCAQSLGFLAAYLAFLWLAQPMINSALHLCPMRGDGIQGADALPAFARKYHMSCEQCHYAFPVLNAYGRQFKMNGYVRSPGSDEGVLQSQDKELWTEKLFPWAAIIRSRPFDDGKGGVANQGGQMGGTASPNTNGFKMQAINDVDMFVAGGDAAKEVSFFGEMDANAPGGFSPGLGDLRLGYHPGLYFNAVAMRRGFFADDPYQTIVSNESPTIANRATDLLFNDQGSISGNQMISTPQTLEIYGQYFLPHSQDSFSAPSFLYYSGAVYKDADSGTQATAPTNGAARLAWDDTGNSGLMLGTFGTYGHEGPMAAAGASSGAPGLNAAGPGGELTQFVRGGFDALWEGAGFAARAAFVYSHDEDPAVRGAAATDRAAYAELAYAYLRNNSSYPFLMPLVRENWYTTFNGAQQFNYLTFQLAHYFAANFKAFVEYSLDTKRAYQGGSLAAQGSNGTLQPLGDRVTAQIEVGF